MNDAHLHLVVNHFPIIGTVFGLGILIFGLILNNNATKNVAYVLFIASAILAFLSIKTGGAAAHMVTEMPNLSIEKEVIHTHAELAGTFAIVCYLLGLVSLVGLYLNIKNNPKAKLVSFLVLTIAAICTFLGKEVATSGGEVRHTEIRTDENKKN